MNCVTIGSCRITNDVSQHFCGFTHSTKDILQLFSMIEKTEKEVIDNYTPYHILINPRFKDPIKTKKTINQANKALHAAKIVVIEISSIKDVKYKDLCLQLDLYQSLGH